MAMLQEVNPTSWHYSGELVRDNVTTEWKLLTGKTQAKQAVEVNLGGLSRVDSAGLAMLVCWQNMVKKQGGELRFVDIPAQLANLIRVSDLETLFFADMKE